MPSAIIVPYRDMTEDKRRAKELEQFIEYMGKYLGEEGSPSAFHIFVIHQQDNDGRKFNRGKLLNIGFELAAHQGYNVFIFHDVDLLPHGDGLKRLYFTVPNTNNPIHIANLWDRYQYKGYIGGIVSFSKKGFEKINGFPNNFWGWGGEDDELFNRVADANMKPVVPSPSDGHIQDLENLSLKEKLSLLRQNKNEKNMQKIELLQEHKLTQAKNGLSNLKFFIIDLSQINSYTTFVTVDVRLNNHWSDQLCYL